MTEDKEIRFTEKKIDESWKEQAARDKDVLAGSTPKPAPASSKSGPLPTLKPFLNLITSLGYQGMMMLGEIPNPETQEKDVHLEGAREIIDLLLAIQKKSEGNLSPEESKLLESLIPDLQMKFAEKA